MSNDVESKLPSERKFGAMFTILLVLVAACATLRNWGLIWRVAALAAGVTLGVTTLSAPALLAPLNRAWFYVGRVMSKVTSPVVLGVIFFFLLTPTAIVARLCGRDELRLRFKSAHTYWISRDPPGSISDSFKHQF